MDCGLIERRTKTGEFVNTVCCKKCVHDLEKKIKEFKKQFKLKDTSDEALKEIYNLGMKTVFKFETFHKKVMEICNKFEDKP